MDLNSTDYGCMAWIILIFFGACGIAAMKDYVPLGLFMIIFAIGLFIYMKWIANEEKEKEEYEKKKLNNLPYKLNRLAQSFGYKTYNPTITINDYFSIDENKKLFHYASDLDYPIMLRTQNIKTCRIELETKIQNNAMSQGLADGILAGITGVGIIRDADSLKEEAYTGKAFLFITFTNSSGNLITKKFYFNDSNRAEKVKVAIDRIIF